MRKKMPITFNLALTSVTLVHKHLQTILVMTEAQNSCVYKVLTLPHNAKARVELEIPWARWGPSLHRLYLGRYAMIYC
jgi:hypothetical protein